MEENYVVRKLSGEELMYLLIWYTEMYGDGSWK